jgi:hypothetical protein
MFKFRYYALFMIQARPQKMKSSVHIIRNGAEFVFPSPFILSDRCLFPVDYLGWLDRST